STPSRTRRGGSHRRPPVGRNSSIGNSTAIRFHISSGTRQTVGTRRRLLLRPAAIHTSTPSPCDVQQCRTPWRAGDPALNHLWDRLLGLPDTDKRRTVVRCV